MNRILIQENKNNPEQCEIELDAENGYKLLDLTQVLIKEVAEKVDMTVYELLEDLKENQIEIDKQEKISKWFQ